jgi:hypothetical protein
VVGFPGAGFIGVPRRVALRLRPPALLWAAGNATIALGFTLDRRRRVPLTLAAVRPGASNVTLLTDRYGAGTGRAVLFSTVLAFLGFNTLAWNLGAGQASLK